MKEKDARRIIRMFLKEHPEQIPGAKIDGGQLLLDKETLIAFTEWTIKNGHGEPEKAKRFLAFIKGQE